jgi:mycoredoxin
MRNHSITMYTTKWCGHCRRLKRQLDEAGISATEVDIDAAEHAHLGKRIEQRTGGYRIVPTVVVADELLVNPTLQDIRSALAGLPAN